MVLDIERELTGSTSNAPGRPSLVIAVCGPDHERAISAANLAWGLAATGESVVLVDADEENLIAHWLGISSQEIENLDRQHRTFSSAIAAEADLAQCASRHSPAIIFAGARNVAVDVAVGISKWRLEWASILIRKLRLDYEFVVLCCPPGLSVTAALLIQSSDMLVIPFTLGDLATLQKVSQFELHSREIHVARKTDMILPLSRQRLAGSDHQRIAEHFLAAVQNDPERSIEIFSPIQVPSTQELATLLNAPANTTYSADPRAQPWIPAVEYIRNLRETH